MKEKSNKDYIKIKPCSDIMNTNLTAAAWTPDQNSKFIWTKIHRCGPLLNVNESQLRLLVIS